jgi:hypothetical protein
MKEAGCPRYRGEMATAQIIEDDDVMPGLDQLLCSHAANIPGPPGYQYMHELLLYVPVWPDAI